MAAYIMTVSLDGSDTIECYNIDALSGVPSKRSGLRVGDTPGAQVVDAAGRFLYVSIRGENKVATVAVEPKSGSLRIADSTPVVSDAVYLSLDKTGAFLLTSYYTAGKAAVYPIRPDGIVDHRATAELTIGSKNPHSIQADPSNRFVYIPNTSIGKILQFRFNSREGTLSPAEPPEVITTQSAPTPRHFWFHPNNDIVYFINERSSSVTAFQRDSQTGTLTAFQTISTLPSDYSGTSMCAHIETTPSGKYLYASNRGHDSLAIYSIDPSDGMLALIGHQPTPKKPRSFTIHPTGRFLYCAGLDNNELAAYKIDENSGWLQRLASYDVGPGPSWVQVIRVPN